MPSQELQWMAVPYDVEKRDGKTFLSVAVCLAPRLQDVNTNDNKLSDYPEWVDWPTTLKNVGIGLDINGTIISAGSLTPKDEQPDSESWKAVFAEDSLVRPFEYAPFTNYQIISFPVKNVIGTMKETYKSLLTTFEGAAPVLRMPVLDVNSDLKFNVQAPKIFAALQSITPNSVMRHDICHSVLGGGGGRVSS